MREQLLKIIKEFSQASVLVVGDSMIDEYLHSSINRISPEAPVPVAKVDKIEHVLGGAANVAHNVAALGASVHLVSVIGQDSFSDTFFRLCREKNINIDGVVVDASRPTIVKTRVLSRQQHIIRIDRENDVDVSEMIEEGILKNIQEKISQVSVIVISDYAKGVVTERVAKEIISLGKKNNIPVLVDPRFKHPKKYEDAFLIKANRQEAVQLSQALSQNIAGTIEEIGEGLRKWYRSNFIITLSENGLLVFEDGNIVSIPVTTTQVVDVCGAGDTCLAGIATAVASAATLHEAAVVGNLCSGVVVAKPGTAACSHEELLVAVQKHV